MFTGIFYIVCVTPGAIFIAAKDYWNGGNAVYTFSPGTNIPTNLMNGFCSVHHVVICAHQLFMIFIALHHFPL